MATVTEFLSSGLVDEIDLVYEPVLLGADCRYSKIPK
jgi:hypothetical protein